MLQLFCYSTRSLNAEDKTQLHAHSALERVNAAVAVMKSEEGTCMEMAMHVQNELGESFCKLGARRQKELKQQHAAHEAQRRAASLVVTGGKLEALSPQGIWRTCTCGTDACSASKGRNN